jgi:hypothetical protein
LSKIFSRNGWNEIGIVQFECDRSEQILTCNASIVGPSSYPSIWQVQAVSHLFQKSMKRNVSFQYIGFPSVTSRVDTTIEEIFWRIPEMDCYRSNLEAFWLDSMQLNALKWRTNTNMLVLFGAIEDNSSIVAF